MEPGKAQARRRNCWWPQIAETDGKHFGLRRSAPSPMSYRDGSNGQKLRISSRD